MGSVGTKGGEAEAVRFFGKLKEAGGGRKNYRLAPRNLSQKYGKNL